MTRLTWLVGAASLAACAHGADLAHSSLRAGPAAFSVPRDVAGAARWEPAAAEGKVLAVMFMASWCFPCLTELGVMQRLQDDLGDQGLVTVVVGMDLEGHRVLDPFAQATGGTLPIAVADEALRKGDSPFGLVRELPTRFLFGRDGALVAAWAGAADPRSLRKKVEAALATGAPKK